MLKFVIILYIQLYDIINKICIERPHSQFLCIQVQVCITVLSLRTTEVALCRLAYNSSKQVCLIGIETHSTTLAM